MFHGLALYISNLYFPVGRRASGAGVGTDRTSSPGRFKPEMAIPVILVL